MSSYYRHLQQPQWIIVLVAVQISERLPSGFSAVSACLVNLQNWRKSIRLEQPQGVFCIILCVLWKTALSALSHLIALLLDAALLYVAIIRTDSFYAFDIANALHDLTASGRSTSTQVTVVRKPISGIALRYPNTILSRNFKQAIRHMSSLSQSACYACLGSIHCALGEYSWGCSALHKLFGTHTISFISSLKTEAVISDCLCMTSCRPSFLTWLPA